MTMLMEVQGFAQAVADAVAAVIGVEVGMVDENLLTLVGSGKYARHIGRTLGPDSVSARVLAERRTIVIRNPRHDEVCSGCTQKGRCSDAADVITPMVIDGRPAGCVLLVACTEEQKDVLLGQTDRWVEFLERMTDLISRAFKERQQTARMSMLADQFDAVINSVSEGILTLDGSGTIRHANQAAYRLLRTQKDRLISRHVSEVLPGVDAGVLGKAGPVDLETFSTVGNEKAYWLATIRPFAGRALTNGYVLTFRGTEEIPRMVANYIRSERHSTFDDILGSSSAITGVKRIARSIAASDSTVLIQGESGTGKELLARAIHFESPRHNGPFVAVNCAAIPESILESELFGYEEGAFTGAKRGGKPGKFELAHGGTLFLDEIGDMPLHLQGKLLRAVEERRVDRLGGRKTIPIDIRIIAATNRDLKRMTASGQFRPDLYYRLAVIPIIIPPLREHREDIPEYVAHFVAKYARELGKNVAYVEPRVMEILMSYDWPGNIRELSNVIEYAVNMVKDRTVNLSALPEQIVSPSTVDLHPAAGHADPPAAPDVPASLPTFRFSPRRVISREDLREALERYGRSTRSKEAIAAALGISRATLYRKLRQFGLQ